MTALRRLLVPRQTRSEVWRLVLPSVRMAVSQQQQVRHSTARQSLVAFIGLSARWLPAARIVDANSVQCPSSGPGTRQQIDAAID